MMNVEFLIVSLASEFGSFRISDLTYYQTNKLDGLALNQLKIQRSKFLTPS